MTSVFMDMPDSCTCGNPLDMYAHTYETILNDEYDKLASEGMLPGESEEEFDYRMQIGIQVKKHEIHKFLGFTKDCCLLALKMQASINVVNVCEDCILDDSDPMGEVERSNGEPLFPREHVPEFPTV